MRLVPRVLPGLLLAVITAGAAAQNAPKPLPILRGAIQDTLGHGLEGAQIEILGLDRTVTTPGSGAYRFEEIKPGKYWVIARRIGYQPLKAALTFEPGDDREIVFQLQPLAYNLPEVKVRAENKKWERQYRDFVWRSRSSLHGYFLTRDDIDRSHATFLGDAVRRYLPFVNSEAFFTPFYPDPFGSAWGQSGIGWVSSRSSGFNRACSPAVSVNGSPPTGGWAVNDFRPDDVEAVEVYRSASQAPIEFLNYAGGGCGLVVVWTR
jgi:carboxypeptidase family protein